MMVLRAVVSAVVLTTATVGPYPPRVATRIDVDPTARGQKFDGKPPAVADQDGRSRSEMVPHHSAVRYKVTAERGNSAQPVISTRLHMPTPVNGSHTASSTFFFNFNPTFLWLPDRTPAIILRSVARQRDPATAANPDVLTLSRVRTSGDFGAITSDTPVIIDPVNESSIILRPSPNSTLDDHGVQDPRVMQAPVRYLQQHNKFE